MWLFREKRERLQGGMVSSMQVRPPFLSLSRVSTWTNTGTDKVVVDAQYLYLDSEVWTGLKTLLWRAFSSLFPSSPSYTCLLAPYTSAQTTAEAKERESRRKGENGGAEK